eukprot:SAG22_NODE_186_length_15907_cov_45.496774_8_plen_467_part_00
MCFVFLAYYPLENVQSDICTVFSPCDDDRIVVPESEPLTSDGCVPKSHEAAAPTRPRFVTPPAGNTCDKTAPMPSEPCFTAEDGAVAINWACDGDGYLKFHLIMPAKTASSWAAIGFSDDQSMAGSDVVLASASGGVRDMWADAHSMPMYDDTQSGGTDDVHTGASVSSAGGRLEVTFRRKLTTVDGQFDMSFSRPLHIIYAYGGEVSDPSDVHSRITQHTKQGFTPDAVLMPSSSSCAAAAAQTAVAPSVSALLRAHGVLQTVSFLLLLFPGALLARNRTVMKGATWFRSHIVLQLAGTAGSLLAVFLAFKHVGAVRLGAGVGMYHTVAGAATFFLVLVQVGLALMRPVHESSLRAAWQRSHSIVAVAIMVLAAYSLLSGLVQIGAAAGASAGYVLGLVTAVSLVVGLEKLRAAGGGPGVFSGGAGREHRPALAASERMQQRLVLAFSVVTIAWGGFTCCSILLV